MDTDLPQKNAIDQAQGGTADRVDDQADSSGFGAELARSITADCLDHVDGDLVLMADRQHQRVHEPSGGDAGENRGENETKRHGNEGVNGNMRPFFQSGACIVAA